MSSHPNRTGRERWIERALEELLQPLARLCLGHGIPFSRIEEMLKRAYVDAARLERKRSGASATRDISQLAVTTGLHRRDVARISAEARDLAPRRLSPATQVLTLWLSDPAYRRAGKPLQRLPRQGLAPSFEALAQAVTRHVHPRSLLDELARLGLVQLDVETDEVEMLKDSVVPDAHGERLYALLGANVGDHLSAATDNVLGSGPRHVEQAVFAEGMSAEAALQAELLAREHWAETLKTLAPQLQRLIDADREAGRPCDHRVRVGIYSYQDQLPEAQDGPAR